MGDQWNLERTSSKWLVLHRIVNNMSLHIYCFNNQNSLSGKLFTYSSKTHSVPLYQNKCQAPSAARYVGQNSDGYFTQNKYLLESII